jgi:hypothetical protein
MLVTVKKNKIFNVDEIQNYALIRVKQNNSEGENLELRVSDAEYKPPPAYSLVKICENG